MLKNYSTIAALALIFVAANTANAAKVQLSIILNGNDYEVRASEVDGDNFGIASLGIALGGGVQTIENMLPFTSFAQDAAFAGGTAGFSNLRTGDGAIGGSTNPLFGTQNTIDPTPHLLYGFGQQASSFAGEGLNPLGGAPKGDTWDANLLVAQGTWDGVTEPTIDFGNVQTFSNVFTSDSGAATTAAAMELAPTPGGGLAGMYVGPGAGLSEGLQDAFTNRNGGPIVLENAIMLSNTDTNGTLADLMPISALVLFGADTGDAFADAVVEDTDDDGKYNITIGADWASLPLDQILAGEIVFSTQASGANPNLVGFDFSIRVPEPSTIALSSLALVGLVGFARRRK